MPSENKDLSIIQLLAVMRELRDPVSGCPWDLAQDFRSIAAHTIEEAHEVADAIERDDFEDLKDELGDLLFQVVFHSCMAQELGIFDFNDVVAAIVSKLYRRHPHVFGDQSGLSSDEVKVLWEDIKANERAAKLQQDESAMAGVAAGLPALRRAIKLQKRAARVGFDWPSADAVLDKINEELGEAKEALTTGDTDHIEDELGDLLFAVTNLARHAAVDPGSALRRSNHKFEQRFRAMELLAGKKQVQLKELQLEQKEELWRAVKQCETP